MSLKAGNFSFRACTAQNWSRMGKYGTNLEPHRSQEAPCTAQPSIHPPSSELELILASRQCAASAPPVRCRAASEPPVSHIIPLPLLLWSF